MSIEVSHDWKGDQWDWPLQHNDGVVHVTNTKDVFSVGLEAVYFTPKEIEVKVIGNELVIHCRHEQRADEHGSITREVNRAYKLPPDVDTSTIKSNLSPRGVLTIQASKKK